MAKNNLASMSIEALFKLRDDVAEAIAGRAADLRRQLSKLTAASQLALPGNGKVKGRRAIPQQEKSQCGLVGPRRSASLDESGNEGDQSQEGKLSDQSVRNCVRKPRKPASHQSA